MSDLLAVNVLGPVRADIDGAPVALGRGLRPRLLAWLALRRNAPVTVERTIDAIWPGTDVATGRSRLASLVWSTRRVVAPADLGVSRERARLLVTLAPDQFDVSRFETAIGKTQAATSSDPFRTVDALTASLALWRGEPFPELGHDPDGIAEAYRLCELRLDALEHLHGLQTVLGPPPGLAAEIASVIDADPTRQTSWRQLMAALQATDRQVEALRAFHDCRRALLTHGLTPSPQTRAVEHALIEGRPPPASLLLPSHEPAPSGPRSGPSWPLEVIGSWVADRTARLVIVEVRDATEVPTAARHLRDAAPPAQRCVFTTHRDDPDRPGARSTAIRSLQRLAPLAKRMPVILVVERTGGLPADPRDDVVSGALLRLLSAGGELLVIVVAPPQNVGSAHLRASAAHILEAPTHH